MVTPRLAYFGTPEFAVPSLAALLAAGHDVAGVVTQPDRPRGRGQHVSASPVKAYAERHGLPTLQPTRLQDPAFITAFLDWRVDLAVVAAYGRLLPASLLDLPRLGFVNVHASLLPRWRGAAPVHRAILAGDADTGVTIMRVVLALDAGPMLSQSRIAIDPEETSADLEKRLAHEGASLLVATLSEVIGGRAAATPQDDRAVTHAAKIDRRDSPINWTRRAIDLHNQIRGLHPWPLASTSIGGRRVIVGRSSLAAGEERAANSACGEVIDAHGTQLVVATGDGALALTALQLEGRAMMDAGAFINGAFINGARITRGDRFDAPRTA